MSAFKCIKSIFHKAWLKYFHTNHHSWLEIIGCISCIGVQCHFNCKCHIMAVGDAYVSPGFLTPVLTQLFFPKPPTTFLTCFCRGERRKYAGKKSRLNQGSNSQPPGHESDTLTTEPPGRVARNKLVRICITFCENT